LGLVTIIIVKVVPAFSDFYSSFGAELPLITRIIVRISDFVRGQFWLIVIGAAVGITAFVGWVRQPGRQAKLDHVLLSLPGLRQIASKLATAPIAPTLANTPG